MAAAALTEDARKKANLRLLQRSIDPNIQDIVGNATHVVLYEYITPQGWEKSQVEGSLFLVSQQDPHQHHQQQQSQYSLAILNRNSTENFQVSVTSTFQLQHKEPYLIFKQSPKILGIWFHNANERVVMASLLNQVILNLKQPNPIAVPTPPPTRPPHQVAAGGGGGGGDASPMITQMQQLQMSSSTTTTPAAAAASSSSRSQHANVTSPSQFIEPLMNSLFASPTPVGGNTSTTTTSTTTTTSHRNERQSSSAATTTTTTTPPPPPSSAPNTTIPGVALDKKSLQLALLSLIQDERFIDLLHAQYLKVAHARAHRDNNNKK